jgi:hypothetical protein
MKQIEVEKKTKVIHYEAIDGTVFLNKEECKTYEDTAKCVLLSRYNKLKRVNNSEYSFFNVGSDEYSMDAVKVSCVEDIDLILKVFKLFNPHSDAYIDNNRSILEKALKENDVVFIGRGDDYSENFWISFTLSEAQNKLNSLLDEINKA